MDEAQEFVVSAIESNRNCYNTVAELSRRFKKILPPISESCQAIVVVPVYREFREGFILKLLGSLTEQTVSPDQYEIILVVNNPQSADLAREDNKNLIDFIKEKQSHENFPNVRILDCTDGELPARHLGIIRGLGNEVAVSRLEEARIGDEGIIIQLDADTQVDSNFIKTILDFYRSHPNIDSAVIGMSVIPARRNFSGEDYYLGLALQFYENVKAYKNHKSPLAYGPTISFRARIHKNPDVKDYMNYQSEEDYMLGMILQRHSNFGIAPLPRVYIADRERPEGFDARMRNFFAKDSVSWGKLKRIIGLALPGLEINPEISSMDELYSKVVTWLEAHHNKLARKFRKFFQEELEIAVKYINTKDVDQHKIRLGALIFSLMRLTLEARQEKAREKYPPQPSLNV